MQLSVIKMFWAMAFPLKSNTFVVNLDKIKITI